MMVCRCCAVITRLLVVPGTTLILYYLVLHKYTCGVSSVFSPQMFHNGAGRTGTVVELVDAAWEAISSSAELPTGLHD